MKICRARKRNRRSSPKSGPLCGKNLGVLRERSRFLEQLEERALLSLAPLGVDLQAASDSGLYDDDNLTNVRTPTIDITAARPATRSRSIALVPCSAMPRS